LTIQRRKGLPRFDGRLLRRRAERLQQLAGVAERELSILLTDDAETTRLNQRYRHRARTTDVLAFSQLEGPSGGLSPSLLGDVILCVPQASRQARQRRSTLDQELAILLVHGLLHLLGYEHEGVDRRRAREMWRAQERLAAALNSRRQR
jgi:probable rRNA maturation factor